MQAAPPLALEWHYTPLFAPFVQRIQEIRRRRAQKYRPQQLREITYFILLAFIIVITLEYHTHLYNILYGPFSMDVFEFIVHMHAYRRSLEPVSPESFRWFLLHREYVQVALGSGQIVQSTHPLRVLSKTGRLMATFRRVIEPNIARALEWNQQFYIKLPSRNFDHFYTRLPFQFHMFNILTLRCVVRELGMQPTTYETWSEKKFYVQWIERYYAENTTDFNAAILTRCGLLLGRLRPPVHEKAFLPDSREPFPFNRFDLALDMSEPYRNYLSIAFTLLTLAAILSICFFHVGMYLYVWYQGIIPVAIRRELRRVNAKNLASLDSRLTAAYQCPHDNGRLLLLDSNSLVVFRIDPYEYSDQQLKQFATDGVSPFFIVQTSKIERIIDRTVIVVDTNQRKIDLGSVRSAQWLHEKLFSLNQEYRKRFEEHEP